MEAQFVMWKDRFSLSPLSFLLSVKEFCPILNDFNAFSPSNLNSSTEPKHSFPISNDSKDAKLERLSEVAFENDPSPTERDASFARPNSYSWSELSTSNNQRATIEIQRRFIDDTDSNRF